MVNPHFKRRFELIAKETAIEIYGRAPKVIRHAGAYYYRRIRRWPYLMSEHGLANAIDVEGFDFASAKGEDAAGLPKALRRALNEKLTQGRQVSHK